MDIFSLRKDYKLSSLDVAHVESDPLIQFKKWFEEAIQSEALEANAMVLSTISEDLKPHARVVLIKEFNEKGFTFFTNYKSNKGKDLAAHPFASLLFFWPELERQVRIEGNIEKTERTISEKYFHSRPRGSQIGAYASPQSQVIPDRNFLETKMEEFQMKFGEEEIPWPEFWGGYLLKHTSVEFWQGRSNRLHDRILYEKNGIEWKISRMAP